MTKTYLFYLGLMMVLSASLIACKKTKEPEREPGLKEEKRSVLGTWQEIPVTASSRKLAFLVDGKFAILMSQSNNHSIIQNGSYTVNGDKLKIKVVEQLERQGTAEATRTEINQELFENATFKIENSVLIIKYITYPADAPVETELKFKIIL
nr:hypothetical protein [Pedobacter panaciterrae]